MLSQNTNALGIIFPNSYDNTVPALDCVGTDKNVKITAGKTLSGTESFPVYVQKKHTV